MFKDREEAGIQLAERLMDFAGQPDVVILALPRGGVVTGNEIAKRLNIPLDVFIVRKIGHPLQPSLPPVQYPKPEASSLMKRLSHRSALRRNICGARQRDSVRKSPDGSSFTGEDRSSLTLRAKPLFSSMTVLLPVPR